MTVEVAARFATLTVIFIFENIFLHGLNMSIQFRKMISGSTQGGITMLCLLDYVRGDARDEAGWMKIEHNLSSVLCAKNAYLVMEVRMIN